MEDINFTGICGFLANSVCNHAIMLALVYMFPHCHQGVYQLLQQIGTLAKARCLQWRVQPGLLDTRVAAPGEMLERIIYSSVYLHRVKAFIVDEAQK